jgi:hypothetical protein
VRLESGPAPDVADRPLFNIVAANSTADAVTTTDHEEGIP